MKEKFIQKAEQQDQQQKMISGHQAWTQKKYWNKMFYAIIKLSVSVSFLNVY